MIRFFEKITLTVVLIFAFFVSSMIAVDASYPNETRVFEPIEDCEDFSEQIQKDIDEKYLQWCEEQPDFETDPPYIIEITIDEIDMLARVVMSESSTLCYDAKVATAMVVINRVRSDYREFKKQTTVSDVINKPNQFSTQDNGDISDECYEAVYDALLNGDYLYPSDMLWFCKSSKSYGNVYVSYGNNKRKTYFSTVNDYQKTE